MARVLVVDDDRLHRELLSDWLEVEGHVCETATTLEEGRKAVERFQPELVLLDVQLRAENGLDLIPWLRATPAHSTPVVAVTAHALFAARESILASGCNACMSKPIDFQALRQEMLQWLKKC